MAKKNLKTIKEQVLDAQMVGSLADPMWKAEFLTLIEKKQELTPLELRLIATIIAFIRDNKV